VRVSVSGATGLIGRRLVAALTARGDEVTVLSRAADRAAAQLGVAALPWDPLAGPPPADALAGRDAVIHLAGAPVAQRWNAASKQAIRDSRELGTRNLVTAIAALDEGRPAALVSASAVGYYGPHGDERVSEDTPAGDDFLADVCVRWEREAARAGEHGVRSVQVRTGIVLDAGGGALAQMLTPFKLGVGGPVAGGRQYMPWIHVDDVVGLYLRALDDSGWAGPYNASAPEPVTNKQFSRALGHVLHRPAISPVPKLALRVLYGEMAEVVASGQRAVPARALADDYEFAYTDVEAALRATLGRD
jgi:uncharacterized protein (TIGR01777 family)